MPGRRAPNNHYGIILAAGEGKRLQPFVRRLQGDSLPKQYVRLLSNRSTLEATFDRVETIIPADSLYTVVSRGHLVHPEARRQLSRRPAGTVILQPENRETAPGILLPLIHIHKRDPDSIVAVFPSDHFVVEDELFMQHVETALRVVNKEPGRVVTLGVEPEQPEPEYGYILPGISPESLSWSGARNVLRFIEKPSFATASRLHRLGALWNTMVMVFKSGTLLDLVRRCQPRLYYAFEQVMEVIGTSDEDGVVEQIYRKMEPINFSKGLLEAFSARHSSSLLVLPVRGVRWSDLGAEKRITAVLSEGKEAQATTRLRSGVPGGIG